MIEGISKVEATNGPTAQGHTGVRASVVIPALNEARVIGECLQSLARMRLPGGPIEVIVVDNGSNDRTLEIVESFRCSLNLTVLTRPGISVSAVRNCGAAAASGEMLAFLDADCVVPETWLTNAADELAKPGYALVGAFYSIPLGSSWVATTWCHHISRQPNGEVPYLGAHNLVLRRSTFQKIGGFDESLETNEDYEFCKRVTAAKLKVFASEALSVVHLGTPQTLADFFKRERWHGRHVIKVFMRDVRELANIRAVLFSVYCLSLAILFVSGLVGIALGRQATLAWMSLGALAIGAMFLSVLSTLRSQRWSEAASLTVLFLTWGVARATSLLDLLIPRRLLGRKWQSKQ